jgi:hypothetical protein
MEHRSRSARPAQASGVKPDPASDPLAALEHLNALIQTEGQITLGLMSPVGCVAIANDDHTCLAMLRKRKDETLHQLLVRLDAAIGKAWDEGEFADEINAPR